MKYCTNCGKENTKNICPYCGVKRNKIFNFCAWCGSEISNKASVCPVCKEKTKSNFIVRFLGILFFTVFLFVATLEFDENNFIGGVLLVITAILCLPFCTKLIKRFTHQKFGLRRVLRISKVLLIIGLLVLSIAFPLKKTDSTNSYTNVTVPQKEQITEEAHNKLKGYVLKNGKLEGNSFRITDTSYINTELTSTELHSIVTTQICCTADGTITFLEDHEMTSGHTLTFVYYDLKKKNLKILHTYGLKQFDYSYTATAYINKNTFGYNNEELIDFNYGDSFPESMKLSADEILSADAIEDSVASSVSGMLITVNKMLESKVGITIKDLGFNGV